MDTGFRNFLLCFFLLNIFSMPLTQTISPLCPSIHRFGLSIVSQNPVHCCALLRVSLVEAHDLIPLHCLSVFYIVCPVGEDSH